MLVDIRRHQLPSALLRAGDATAAAIFVAVCRHPQPHPDDLLRVILYTMAAETFDLADAISKLLVRLREFRRKLKAVQPIMQQLRLAIRRHNSALEKRTVLVSSPLPEQERERRKAEAQRPRQDSKVEKVRQALADRWNQYQASIAFIGPFQSEVELVLERLPLKPEWQRFPGVIRSLQIAQLGSPNGT